MEPLHDAHLHVRADALAAHAGRRQGAPPTATAAPSQACPSTLPLQVAVLSAAGALLMPIGSAPKSKAAKVVRRALHAVANSLQAVL